MPGSKGLHAGLCRTLERYTELARREQRHILAKTLNPAAGRVQ